MVVDTAVFRAISELRRILDDDPKQPRVLQHAADRLCDLDLPESVDPSFRSGIATNLVIALLGVPAALSLDVLGLMDQIAGTLFLILGGLAMALFVGFVMPDPLDEAARGASGLRWFFLWRGLLRWVVPAVLGMVLVFACMDTWKAIFDVVESMQGAD